MKLNRCKGRMFRSIDYTGTYYQGCDHGCRVCWTQFMPGGPISHEPRLMQTDEFELLPDKIRDCCIFLNSAHDTFAECIPADWIKAEIRWMGRQHESIEFYLQSQNVERGLDFLPELNKIRNRVYIGTTMQTDDEELIKAISNAPSIYRRYMAMLRFGSKGYRLRLSLEPMYKFRLWKMREMILNIKPELVEVGLDNYAHRHKLDIPQIDIGGYLRLYDDMVGSGIRVVEKRSIAKWRRRMGK